MHDVNFESWFINIIVKVSTFEKPVVLVFDGHNGHLTYQTVKLDMDNNVVLV